MNRFKFRAWHTEQKRMFEVYGLGLDFVTENTLDGVDPGNNCWQGEELKFIKVMQLSNILSEKAKQDIYVGDVIKHRLAAGLGMPESDWRRTVVSSVEDTYSYYIDVRLIGNIYSNPELYVKEKI